MIQEQSGLHISEMGTNIRVDRRQPGKSTLPSGFKLALDLKPSLSCRVDS
jgi:hypothetical protein